MAVFRCKRFPVGEAPIRTRVGLVVFTDGRAEVTDPEVAAALREVPAAFEITEDVAGAGGHGAAPARPPVRARRTGKASSTSTARR